jgi:hypothetical protein
MVSHNSRISSLASLVLAPEQTVGASVNWTLPKSLRIAEADLLSTARKFGLDEDLLGSPTSALGKFKTWHASGSRIPRPRGSREIVSTTSRHDDKGLVTFVYSANLDGVGKEKGLLAPVGSVTFEVESSRFRWMFDCGKQQSSETFDEYVDRALVENKFAGQLEKDDLLVFARFADQSLNDVALFHDTPSYCGDSLRVAAASTFRKLGGYSMSDRGGFWYLPRTDGGPACPLSRAEVFMQTIEESSSGVARFSRLTMPKDASTLEVAGGIVSEGLAAQIRGLSSRVSEIKEVTRKGQHTTRLEELSEVRSKIELYREMLGLFDEDLLSEADEVEQMMRQQMLEFESSLPSKPSKAERKGKVFSEPLLVTSNKADAAEAVYLVDKAALLLSLEAEEVRIVSGDFVRLPFYGNVDIVVESDLAFGFVWTMVNGPVVLGGGSEESLSGVAHAAVELHGRA